MVTESALITVIVAGRDVATLAAEALESLLAQTEQRWCAFLVDDGSVDETGPVFHAFAARDDRFQVIALIEPGGLGAARNVALDRVHTEYLTFFDADDVMEPRALEVLLTSLQNSGSDMAVGTYVRLRYADALWQKGDVQPWVRASVSPPETGATLADHPAVVGNIVAWSKLTRHELWQRTGARFPIGVLYEDQVVAQQLYVAARGIDLVDEVVVQWRIRAEGASITQREADPAVLFDCLTQMSASLEILADHSPAALSARASQILRMDLPRLASVAEGNPIAEAMVKDFAATLLPTAADREGKTQSPANPDDPLAPTVGAVYDRILSWAPASA